MRLGREIASIGVAVRGVKGFFGYVELDIVWHTKEFSIDVEDVLMGECESVVGEIGEACG